MGEDEDESSAVVAAVEDGDGEEVEEEAHNVLLPAETIDRKESVELWKSRNETDVIVADHDVFGTDENDEDSLDSLLRYQSNLSSEPSSSASECLVALFYPLFPICYQGGARRELQGWEQQAHVWSLLCHTR